VRYYYAALLSVLLALSAGGAFVSGDSFTFVQLADTQLGFSAGNDNLAPDIANFEKAVAQINRLKPAFVVISGDLINDEHNPRQIRAFWKVAKEINPDIPLHMVAGNHDLAPGTAADVNSYRKLFGANYYAFSCQESEFVVLDSCLIHYPESDSALRNAQKSWFEEELVSARKRNAEHIFVFTHHPWFVSDPLEGDNYDNIPAAERKDYLALMAKYGADFAAAGHYHKEAFARAGELSMIVTGPVGRALGKDPVGYRVFRVYKDRVEHMYVPL
jgi:serine/threonine-protein phosphatase CPPED1